MFQRLNRNLQASAIAALLAFAPAAGHAAGELVVGIDFQPKSLDPIYGDADTLDRNLFNQIYEPLVRLDSKGNFVPVLATAFTFSSDGTAITFTLREGVTFHDGTPFDAEAVKFNLERIINPDSGTTRRADVSDIVSVEVLSSHEVRVNLLGPSGAALSGFAAEGTLMVSPTAVTTFGEDYSRNPVGTGPFKFVAWSGGERVELVRNDEYWMKADDGSSLPFLDKLTVRTIKNYATGLLELESGNVQILDVVNTQDFERLQARGDIRLVETPQVTALFTVLNAAGEPFKDKRVRQALAQAIDRPTLAKAIAGEYGLVTPTFLPPSDWAYDGSIPGWGYDPAAARALLAEAGVSNLTFNLDIIQREPDATVAQFLQQMLRESGIEMTLTLHDRVAFTDKFYKSPEFQAGMIRGNFPRIDPDVSWGRWLAPDRDRARHGNQDVYDIIEDARLTSDLAARKAKYSNVARKLLDESYIVWLFSRPAMQGVRTNVVGIEQDVGGALILTRARID